MAYNNNTSYFGSVPQEIAMMMDFFSSAADNETIDKTQSSSDAPGSSSIVPIPFFSLETLLPSSESDTHSYRFLSFLSLWFVLIVNPIVVKHWKIYMNQF